MAACKDCKHWGTEDLQKIYEPVTNIKLPPVKLSPPVPILRECKSPKIIYQDLNIYHQEGGASYWDVESYSATFATTGTFSCSCFEPIVESKA